MKITPIIFSTEMVQAIEAGRKKQTRRTVKSHPKTHGGFEIRDNVVINWDANGNELAVNCPYGHPGDVLWVRESYKIVPPNMIFYKADNEYDVKLWKPSIHMPFEACRYFLRVKNIRVERLQKISAEDAIKEGISPISIRDQLYFDYTKPSQLFNDGLPPFWSFNSLWCSINGSESWDANPYIWVVEFEKISTHSEIEEIKKLFKERRGK